MNRSPPPATPSPNPGRRTRNADVVAAVLLTVLLIGAALFLGFATLVIFPMATDSCREHCRTEFVGDAFVAQWAGIGLSLLVAVAGLVYSAVRARLMFIWPLLGFLVLGIGTHVAFSFIDTAIGK